MRCPARLLMSGRSHGPRASDRQYEPRTMLQLALRSPRIHQAGIVVRCHRFTLGLRRATSMPVAITASIVWSA
jgi:hypothetical protein